MENKTILLVTDTVLETLKVIPQLRNIETFDKQVFKIFGKLQNDFKYNLKDNQLLVVTIMSKTLSRYLYEYNSNTLEPSEDFIEELLIYLLEHDLISFDSEVA
jgi:hypothetical protein